ncbi:MAG: thiaminase II [Alphaproteobacteria bacterium]|nr:MAG: thiaminase II [Alphaproteobacteria bacterium]
MMTKFTDELWQDIESLMEKILALPFNRELAAGTLDRDTFRFYVIQDSLYLNSYSRGLSLAAARAPDADAMLRFAKSAQEAIEVERILHAGFLKQFGVTDADLAKADKSPTCAAYTNFILATAATQSYEELVAALLPCFWIYWHVGTTIAKDAAPDNPYKAWIDTYADEAFASAVKAVIGVTDRIAAAASPATRAAMKKAFVLSSIYEWMFWDSAYRGESWPVSI